jgi:hypothetical protein
MAAKGALGGHLEENQPPDRYRALTGLVGRLESDPEVHETRKNIPAADGAAAIRAEQNPKGWWVIPERPFHATYVPGYRGMLVVVDRGLSRDLPATAESVEL